MAKIGRNQPCPCGSGDKYKRCCGSLTPLRPDFVPLDEETKREVLQRLRLARGQEAQREQQQGLGRGIVSTEFKGHRMVAVGAKLYGSPNWKTFHDFLRDYLVERLGKQWFAEERCKPVGQRHQIVRWYEQAVEDIGRLGRRVGDFHVAPMTGAQRAFLNLAYNIYLIAHHAEPEQADHLVKVFVTKLKSDRTDDFIGKLFETYAAAAFLKAGYSIDYIDEAKGNESRVEFVATYPASGKKFSVEVKSRNRSPTEDGPVDEIKRLRVGPKLNRALAKEAAHTRVVMIEVNVRDVMDGASLGGWPKAALDQIRHVEKIDAPDGSAKPSAYVLVTNHAFHNNLDGVEIGAQVLAAGCRIPDFGPDVFFDGLKSVLESKARHAEIFALLDSIKRHYEIPSTFDGDMPELAFAHPLDVPRLRFGQRYLIPDADGSEVEGDLHDAVVLEKEKVAHGIYRLADGRDIHASTPLTDAELEAWKRRPETFFGEQRHVGRKIDNWLEVAEFMYETYRNTPRETLLMWMQGAADFDELLKLSDDGLAIRYCEGAAWAQQSVTK